MNKLLVASIAILTCAIGVFIGAVCLQPCCKMTPCAKGMQEVPMQHGGPHFDKGAGKDFDKRHDFGKKHFEKMTQELDSLMQVTPDQKEKLDAGRKAQDSTFKAMHEEKMKAETALREAIEAETFDQAAVDAAKANLLAVQDKMLDARIAGAKNLKEILSKEQLAKMKDFHKEKAENFKKHKGFGKGTHHGPKQPREEAP